MKLTVELNDAQERRLSEIARQLGVSATELAEAAVRELLAEPDGRFELAARRAGPTLRRPPRSSAPPERSVARGVREGDQAPASRDGAGKDSLKLVS